MSACPSNSEASASRASSGSGSGPRRPARRRDRTAPGPGCRTRRRDRTAPGPGCRTRRRDRTTPGPGYRTARRRDRTTPGWGAGQGAGGEQASHHGSGRGAQPSPLRDRVRTAQREPGRLPARGRRERHAHGPHHQVALARRGILRALAGHLDRQAGAGDFGFHLIVQRQRQAEGVEAGPEVRARRRDADPHAAPRPVHRCASPRRQASSRAAAVATASAGTITGVGAADTAQSGSFSPLPVIVQTTRGPGRQRALRAGLQQAGHAGRGGQLAEHRLLAAQQPVGGEDLPVGDRGDQTAGLVPGRLGRLPRRRVADPDRGRDRLRAQHRRAGDDRRRPAGLEAEHPGHPGGRRPAAYSR